MRPQDRLACILTCVVMCAGIVRADAPGAGAPGLTLRDAVATALKCNETSEIADVLMDRAAAVRRRAYAALLPDLTLNASYTRRDDLIRRDFGTGEPVTRPSAVRYGEAVASLDLFNARAIPVLAAAGRDLEAQRQESGELKRALAYDVSAGFYAVLSQELARDAAARRHAVAEQVVSDARIRLEAGLAAANDVTRSELELASARLALTQAESAVIEERLLLGRLIGLEVTGSLVPPPVDSLDVTETGGMEERARKTRRDLKATRARADALARLAGEPMLGLIPSLTLRGNVSRTREAGRDGSENNWGLALLFSWPLYDGGDRYGLTDQRRADARRAQLEALARERDVGLEVRQSLNDLRTADAAADQADVAARVAVQNAVEVRERFLNGLATALEQADAASSEFEARVEVARQRLARELATLAVSRAIGVWPAGTEDLAGEAAP